MGEAGQVEPGPVPGGFDQVFFDPLGEDVLEGFDLALWGGQSGGLEPSLPDGSGESVEVSEPSGDLSLEVPHEA